MELGLLQGVANNFNILKKYRNIWIVTFILPGVPGKVIDPRYEFLVRKFYAKEQFMQIFGRFAQKSV